MSVGSASSFHTLIGHVKDAAFPEGQSLQHTVADHPINYAGYGDNQSGRFFVTSHGRTKSSELIQGSQNVLVTDTLEEVVIVAAQDLSFSVPVKRTAEKILGFASNKASDARVMSPTGVPVINGRVQLLKDINFIGRPYEITAIMGPSGCGKTTLLNCISRRARGEVTGRILYNGRKASAHGSVKMVYANDRFLPYLTVREQLMFGAILKLGHTTQKARRERTEQVMGELALSHVADIYCGGAWHKGLSTGELRRLSIAMELMGNPRVLLLDEPTSGLDAVLGFEIVYILKQVALRGRTVICSIHQPRSSIFDLFDNLVLMGQGRCLYSGPSKLASKYFSTDGSQAVAEMLVDLASDIPEDYSLQTGVDLESGKSSITLGEGKSGRRPGQAIALAEKFCSSKEMQMLAEEIEIMSRHSAKEVNQTAHKSRARHLLVQWWLEVYAVATRAFWNNLRNPLCFVGCTLVQILIALVLGIISWKITVKFLPANVPPEIGGEDSPILRLFDGHMMKFMTTGIDGKGSNPLFQMLLDGADGNGSMPFSEMTTLPWMGRWARIPKCAYKTFEVDQLTTMYVSTNFSEYDQHWEDDAASNLPEVVSQLLQILQLADFMTYEQSWPEAEAFARLTAMDSDSTSDSAGNVVLIVASYIERYICLGTSGDIFRQMGTCSVPYPDPPNRAFEGFASLCNWYKWLEMHPELDPTRAAHMRLGKVRADLPALADHLPAGPVIDPSKKLKARQTIAGAASRLPDRTGDAPSSKLKLPGSVPARRRRLQAGALVAGGVEGFLDFLPDSAIKMFARIGDYMGALRSCDHNFCQAMDAKMNEASDLSSLGDYGSVLVATLNVAAGPFFFVCMNIGFAAFDALVSFPQERAMFNREVANRTYRLSSYYVGKQVGDWLFQLIPIFCLISIVYGMEWVWYEQENQAKFFFTYAGIALIISWCSYGFTYMISASARSMEVAVTIAPLVIVILLCTSGFFVRDSALPEGLQWVKYLSVYRWGFSALVLSYFTPGGYWNGLPNTFSLAVAGITERSIGLCCGAMIALGVGFRIVGYIFLRSAHRQCGIEQ